MSKSSEYVKKWRKKVKEIILTCMGGQCQICQYKKCPTALELHHVNPDEKDFSFGFIMASCRNWGVIYSEIEKCILLCSNCHREVHAGVTMMPDEYTKFDRVLADSLRSAASLSVERNRGATAESRKTSKRRAEVSVKKLHKNSMLRVKYVSRSQHITKRIQAIETSQIDFSVYGWVKVVATLLGISQQKVTPWMKRHMSEFYDVRCFKRNTKGLTRIV